jgi:predicted transcriptional regulator
MKVRVSFELDIDQKRRMRDLAEKLGLSISEVLRLAIGEYLAANRIALRSSDVCDRQIPIPGCEG